MPVEKGEPGFVRINRGVNRQPAVNGNRNYWKFGFLIACLALLLVSLIAGQLGINASHNAHVAETAISYASTLQPVLKTALQHNVASSVSAKSFNSPIYSTATAVASQDQLVKLISTRLILQSNNLEYANYDQAILLSLEAYRLNHSVEALSNLLAILEVHPGLSSFLPGHSGVISCVAVSPNGTMVASGGDDGSISLWDLVTRRPLAGPMVGHTGLVNDIAFSPDGKFLASAGNDGLIILWDVASGKPFGRPLVANTGSINSVSFSPDGKFLASGDQNGDLILWDLATRRPVGSPLNGQMGQIYKVAFSPIGNLVAFSGEDGTVKLWDVKNRKLFGKPLTGHKGKVFALAFRPDGKVLASGGDDQQILFWDVNSQKLKHDPLQFSSPVLSLAYSSDGTLLAIGGDDQISILDSSSLKPVHEPYTVQSEPVKSLAFTIDGKYLISNGFRAMLLWQVDPTPRIAYQIVKNSSEIVGLAYSPHHNILAVGYGDRSVQLWDAGTAQPLQWLNHNEPISPYNPVFNPDSNLLFTGSNAQVLEWNLDTKQRLPIALSGPQDWVTNLSVSKDGNWIAALSQAQGITLWDLRTNRSTKLSVENIQDRITAMALNPDGKLLAVGRNSGAIQIWDTQTGGLVANVSRHIGPVLSLAYSQDGKMLASGGGDNTVQLWEPDSLSPLSKPLRGHTNWVSALAFENGDKVLVSGGFDDHLILWDVSTQQMLGRPLIGQSKRILALATSPDGNQMISGGQNGDLIFWDTSPEDWEIIACNLVGRNLTQAEWERYLPEIPYHRTCPQYITGK